VELLVIMAICSLLIALAMPVLSVAKEKMKTMRCMNNMRQIGGALLMYCADWGGRFPRHYTDDFADAGDWRTRTDVYMDLQAARIKARNSSRIQYRTEFLTDSKAWWCPSAKKIVISYDATGRPRLNMHYGYNGFALGTAGGTRDVEGPWALRQNAPPNPTQAILVAEFNRNGTWVTPSDVIERTGNPSSNHRVSHNYGKGANYLFADGHVEYIQGDQGTGAYAGSYTNVKRMWKWW
jgi:prepilin-type processing-associated H-X9-DG protein